MADAPVVNISERCTLVLLTAGGTPKLSKNEVEVAHKKFSHKTLKGRKIFLTQADFGVLYACSEIYKGFCVPPYSTLITQLVQSAPHHTGRLRLNATIPCFLTSIEDSNFKKVNTVLADIPVVKAYRAVVGDWVWFQNAPPQ